MRDYSIGEIEQLTGIKSHVLRYWEDVVPFIRPRKDDQGRRYYSKRDVLLIERVKYLVQEKKFTVEGAGEQLLSELTGTEDNKQLHEIQAIKNELLDVYTILKRRNT